MSLNHNFNPVILDRLARITTRSKAWMLDEAFPFWASRTPAPEGGFYEKLDLKGLGIPGIPSRVRLQARMGFTFALAAEFGWDRERCEELAERSIFTLVNDCRRDDGLYGKLVRPGSGLVDDTADAYDSAFALLAFSSVYRVLKLPLALEAGAALSQAIDEILLRPASEGGFKEALPAPTVREQNPHMHLTEASLAWFEASGAQRSMERASDIVRFVQERFYREDLGVLAERSGSTDAENRTEAGHMFEWAWILGQMRHLGGNPSNEFARNLHDGGMKLIEGLGYVPLSQKLDGSVLEPIQRTWGPTEKLKGHIAHFQLEPSELLLETIIATAERMFADHVDEAIPGAWIDIVSPSRESMITDITPATGYHIFLALQELINVTAGLTQPDSLQ